MANGHQYVSSESDEVSASGVADGQRTGRVSLAVVDVFVAEVLAIVIGLMVRPQGTYRVRKLRPRRVGPAVAAALVLVVTGCSAMASRQGLGSHEADLASIETALDITIAEGHLHVLKRSPGDAEALCLGTGTHHASQSLVIDLAGEDAVAVSQRLGDVWQRHADEWMGGGLVVDRGQAVNPGFARITAQQGAWGLEAAVPFNKDLGPYVIDGSAPCY